MQKLHKFLLLRVLNLIAATFYLNRKSDRWSWPLLLDRKGFAAIDPCYWA